MAGRAIVVGASSGIGAALVARLVRDGWKVAAVARRRTELDAVCDLATANGPGDAFAVAHDVTDTASVPGAFADAVDRLGGLDVLVYAAGVMPAIGADEFDPAKDRTIVEVNVIGAMAWLDEGARHLAAQGRGHLVGIGSVAGDRGRIGNPAYCASKAALHTFLEALRNRLDRKGVTVTTVKPGPVHTPMTEGRSDLPLAIDAVQAADAIAGAIRRRAMVAYVPVVWWPIMTVVRSIPSVIFKRLSF
ncbi:MAG: SDR family NAD(P)-dependent oxidoreductase [Alphaproteobacteria bacterium]|nr:SDR family NAD(P)-dependent oxidoreductase [Alphaproteobacteria bacterium]